MNVAARARRALYPIVERRFTYHAYDAFLARLASSDLSVVPLAHLDGTDATSAGVLGIRHDVDVSLDSALAMALLEHAHTIRATYYVLHTAPYWREARLLDRLAELQSLGHEVGWHNDLVTIGCVEGVDARAYLEAELDRLRGHGIAVSGTASHGSSHCYTYGFHNNAFFADFDDEDFPGFPQRRTVTTPTGIRAVPRGSLAEFGFEYEAYHLSNDLYFSDTFRGGRRWHPDDLDLHEIGAGHKAVMLIHPCHWDASGRAKLGRFGRDMLAGKWRGGPG
jgi:hypothetical protein